MIIHTKHQSSRLYGFREYFLRYFYISLCKTDKPLGRAILSPGHYLNKLVEAYQLMLHNQYEVSRLCGFREEDF